MGERTRCPICNRWGSTSLNDYCKACYPKRHQDSDEKNAFADFVGDFNEDPFFPDSFGIVKKKFGYEER